MGQLIEDLTRLLKVIRVAIQDRPSDLTRMARKIFAGLKATAPMRTVECEIEEGLQVRGDPGLLHILVENLLANAWNCTSKTAAARIQFGTAERSDLMTTLFLRDNGIGFDMAYAEDLFVPFHKMHAESELPSTGIGLALAQRVVLKHGGRIWAEAGVGTGATFFFTLPEV